MMTISKRILTINNEEVLVSELDYPFIRLCYDLYVNKLGYVQCKLKIRNMGLPTGELHRILLQPPKGRSVHVDHINRNPLDNRRENLRVCSHKENMRNRNIHYGFLGKNKTSKFKGVSYHKNKNCWTVRIQNDNVGDFDNEIAAVNAYNYYAVKRFGEFSNLNDCPYMDKNEWMKHRRTRKKTSQYRGVSRFKELWIAQIWDGKKNIKIGEFASEIQAAQEYNIKAIQLKGSKAKLNKINKEM